jgi:hypothetical protein
MRFAYPGHSTRCLFYFRASLSLSKHSYLKSWPAMSERSESNGASGMPVELAAGFLSEFRGLPGKMTQRLSLLPNERRVS